MTRHIAVIDIGKTNAKLALVDLVSLTEIAVVTRPNVVHAGPPWPHFDVDGHWAFLLDALAEFHRVHGVDGISVTTHGACAALLDVDGNLAAPILDYEHEIPVEVAAAYDEIRPPFAQTGSPRLSGGLNIGAQLHWQFQADPTLRDRTAQIVTYPQYWGHRLTGVAASDVTSIGCHTDLWKPHDGTFSDLVNALGIDDKLAPVRNSDDILGPILLQISDHTGLDPKTPVCVGIHDSNASLYPHLLTQNSPFSVVSTGTWVIVMTIGGQSQTLDSKRDTLVNVNARGDAVRSARFMGGREYEMILAGERQHATPQDVEAVLRDQIMLMPAVETLSGPYMGQSMHWVGQEPEIGSGARSAALSFYLAMMTDTCLGLTGARGATIVEGPFARNSEYLSMLSAATDRLVMQSKSATGTSIGAALLMGSSDALEPPVASDPPIDPAMWQAYAARWRALADAAP